MLFVKMTAFLLKWIVYVKKGVFLVLPFENFIKN